MTTLYATEALIGLYVSFVSLLCFALFAWDKFCAIKGYWRIPETHLLIYALLGGTPGAFMAQFFLRHKTRKQPFKSRLFKIFAVQILVLAGLAFPYTRNHILSVVAAAMR
jgi:uncharacterized membrane protein YsdA (DUF1294 family)